jgi:hypothetical protein
MRRGDLLAAFIGIVAAAILGELLLAWFWPQRSAETVGMFEVDSAAGYRLRARYENEIRVPEYRTSIRTDTEGNRVPVDAFVDPERASSVPVAGCRRLLAIGDSFTFGVGVQAEEAFPLRLEALLEARTNDAWCSMNGGVGGYGALRSARRLIASQGSFRPEILVHAVYVGNDLEDSNPETILTEPVIQGGRMGSEQFGTFGRIRRSLRIHSHLYSFLRARLYGLYLQTPLAARSQYLDPIGLAVWPESIESVTWPACQDAIRAIDGWSKSNACRYLVVLVPAKHQVDDAAWATYRRRWKLPEDAFDRDHAQRELRAFLDAEGIACCDLLPTFRASTARGEALYYRVDNHWTKRGQALAAERIAEELDARGWSRDRLAGALAARDDVPAGSRVSARAR